MSGPAASSELPDMKLPQLSLRELFLLVALAAVGCGWWVDRLGLQANLQSEQSRNTQLSKDFLEVLRGWRAAVEATP